MSVNKQRKKEFLQSIVVNSGVANVTQIRSETGYSRNQIDYWFPKLVDDGLVKKQYDDQERRVAVLTEKGRTEIEKGEFGRDLLEKEDTGVDEITLSQSEFGEFQERIEKLEQANQAQQERIRELEQNQSHVLKAVGLLQIWYEACYNLLSDEFAVLDKMEEVEEEIMEHDDLPPSFQKYKEERYDEE
ncbi:hypothetical protein [Halosimplex sp. J119]